MPKSARFDDDLRRMNAWRRVVRSLMIENNRCAAEVADATGISRSQIYNFLNGRGVLSLAKIERILEYLGHELDAVRIEPVKVRYRERPVATRCNEVS